MDSDRENYLSPLSTRYASRAMRANFGEAQRIRTWRRVWIALAESQRELGLPIRASQIDQLRASADRIDFARAAQLERELRHDVMAHVHAWGEVCPEARGILHLGATSCDVTDNADLILLRDGLVLLRRELLAVIDALAAFARRWRALPVLGLTHYQPAQATTVGKRACLWLQDLCGDLADLDHAAAQLAFRGIRGATGTQASFLELFGGDHEKVRALERLVAAKLGFERVFAVTGQTYPRRLDARLVNAVTGVCQSAHKFAVDLRLSAGRRELEEPFEEKQIGSSAMPWKRNPMRSERICALARFAIELGGNAAHTAANQWFERTLDDSANRRLVLSEAFLSADAVLNLYLDVARGIVVHEGAARRNLEQELPFLALERLLTAAAKGGADRQDAHERLRVLAREASLAVAAGEPNPLRARIGADRALAELASSCPGLFDAAAYVGRAPEQVDEFLSREVEPLLARHAGELGTRAEVNV